MGDWKHLNDTLSRFVDDGILKGCGMQVMKEDKLVYDHCVGASTVDGSRSFTSETQLRLYSLSKTFTCAAMMTLYEKGHFSLDDPIANYLPEFSNPVVCVSQTDIHDVVPAKRPITIRHLLTMTSGMPYLSFIESDGLVQDAMRDAFDQLVSEPEKNPSLKDLVTMLASIPLCHHPGEHWLYGFSLTVIGRLIEVISQKELSRYLREEIWDPLGLEHTYFNHDVPQGVVIAEQTVVEEMCLPLGFKIDTSQLRTTIGRAVYGSKEDCVPFIGKGINIPCGGIVSTLDDVGKFYRMFANGGRSRGMQVLSKRTIDLMRANHLGAEPLKDCTMFENNRGFGYGLGYRTMLNPAEAGFYMPEGSFGWDGATGCYALANPDHRLAVVFTEQTLPHNVAYTIPRIMAALNADMDI